MSVFNQVFSYGRNILGSGTNQIEKNHIAGNADTTIA